MKSKRLLGFLILTLIVSMIYAYLQTPQQERIAVTNGKVTPRKQGNNLTSSETTKGGFPLLRVDLLERKSQPYPGVQRDLFFTAFRNQQDNEVVFTPPVEPPVIIEPEILIPTPPPPPSPQDVAQKEIAQYKFLGFLKKGEKKTIFLSSYGEIFLVNKGSYLGRDRKYFVLNVTDKTLTLRKEGVGDFSMTLSDQESLSAVPLRNQSKPEQVPVLRPAQQEFDTPDQPEFLTIPDETPTDDQLQPEEDN